jgi:hypothetical protein
MPATSARSHVFFVLPQSVQVEGLCIVLFRWVYKETVKIINFESNPFEESSARLLHRAAQLRLSPLLTILLSNCILAFLLPHPILR